MSKNPYSASYEPTDEELNARKRRNWAIASLLAAFMVFVFMMIIMRSGGILN